MKIVANAMVAGAAGPLAAMSAAHPTVDHITKPVFAISLSPSLMSSFPRSKSSISSCKFPGMSSTVLDKPRNIYFIPWVKASPSGPVASHGLSSCFENIPTPEDDAGPATMPARFPISSRKPPSSSCPPLLSGSCHKFSVSAWACRNHALPLVFSIKRRRRAGIPFAPAPNASSIASAHLACSYSSIVFLLRVVIASRISLIVSSIDSSLRIRCMVGSLAAMSAGKSISRCAVQEAEPRFPTPAFSRIPCAVLVSFFIAFSSSRAGRHISCGSHLFCTGVPTNAFCSFPSLKHSPCVSALTWISLRCVFGTQSAASVIFFV